MAVWKPSVCPKDCPDACGLEVEVANGRAVRVRGDRRHPITRGFLCRKAHYFPRQIHSEKRLTQPLLRVGPKGRGEFKAISWDRALELLNERLADTIDRFGAEAVLPYSYGGHMGLVHRQAGHAFFHKLGATRLEYTICGEAARAGFAVSLGSGPSTDPESAVDSDLILIWGSNTLTTNLHAWPIFRQARAKGARLVVIDPYRNQTARQADWHIKLKPASDAALALGLMHVLIREDLLDHDFIARWTIGFKELKDRAAEYPPDRVAEICGIGPGEVEELALAYGRARAPFVRTGWGPSRQLNGGMNLRTIALLPALVGAFDRPGGGVLRSTSVPLNNEAFTRPDLCPPGTRVLNMVQLGRALTGRDGYDRRPIKLLHVYLCNPAVVAPDSAQVLAGLAREDLFTVVQEQFLTDTAKYADLVLPGRSFMEMTDIFASYGFFYLQMVRPVIPPQGQSRSIWSVFRELAQRLGFTEEVFTWDEEAVIARLLLTDSPYLRGLDLAALSDLRPHRVNCPANPYAQGFQTPSGKVEFYSTSLAEQGLDPLPDGQPEADADGQGRYPLWLITPPHPCFLNSSFNEVDELVRLAGRPELQIHPQDAAARGLETGQEVEVFNDRGRCRLACRVTPDTRPGLVVAEGLFSPGISPGGLGINQLTSQRLGKIGPTCAFHSSLVEVRPASLSIKGG